MRITLSALPLLLAFCALPALAEDVAHLAPDVTFAISGGYWEDPGVAASNGIIKVPGNVAALKGAQAKRGYYRLVSLRQPDRTAKVYLQQMEATEEGPRLADSIELQEITALHAFITDLRPDDSSGLNRGLGFSATIFLKTDAEALEADSWTVVVDDFGEISVDRESH
ncbi:hypothetical protein [Rhizobium paknamense]|uniref:Uncharacterized protein n=1 Tax=Rhizobium paknamense TaxID=1206817 RepID=A0ABU0I6U6_9HYPH|nr:hypothetical protein [Rhizobium paknamense]MDQ0453955.1 hypothetical protein [Rhizobium paknamense]